MTDVVLNLTASPSTSAVKLVVSWAKNGGTPVSKDHPIGSFLPGAPAAFSYLADMGSTGLTADGDVISATAVEVDAAGLTSDVATPTPASVTIPSTPPAPPTNLVLSLK